MEVCSFRFKVPSAKISAQREAFSCSVGDRLTSSFLRLTGRDSRRVDYDNQKNRFAQQRRLDFRQAIFKSDLCFSRVWLIEFTRLYVELLRSSLSVYFPSTIVQLLTELRVHRWVDLGDFTQLMMDADKLEMTIVANTYTQIYIHIVYAVKWRESLIARPWKDRLQKYTTGIVQNQGHKLLAVNMMPDHAHTFIGMRPDVALSDLVRDMKRDSTNFINEQLLPGKRFAWQEGFGAFSYSRTQIDSVVKYILNQAAHHRQRTFRTEYETMLKEFAIDFDSRYVFKWFEPDGC